MKMQQLQNILAKNKVPFEQTITGVIIKQDDLIQMDASDLKVIEAHFIHGFISVKDSNGERLGLRVIDDRDRIAPTGEFVQIKRSEYDLLQDQAKELQRLLEFLKPIGEKC